MTNVSVDPIKVGSVTIEGEAIDDYSISSETCASSTLAPGASCRVRIRFSPSEVGPRSAKLRLDVSAQGGAPPVALTGKGMEAPAKRRPGKKPQR